MESTLTICSITCITNNCTLHGHDGVDTFFAQYLFSLAFNDDFTLNPAGRVLIDALAFEYVISGV